jgi:hypothetical protein
MADQRETLVRKMVDEGTSDDDIRATLKAYDAQQAMAQPASSTPQPSMVDSLLADNPAEQWDVRAGKYIARLAKAHPVQAGATIGGALASGGSSLLPQLGLAALGAAGGAGYGLLAKGAQTGDYGTITGNAKEMATQGAMSAAGEGIGQGVTKAVGVIAPRIYRGVLRPSNSLQRDFGKDLSQKAFDAGLPVSEAGAATADQRIGALSQQVAGELAAKDAERPIVRGFLPPARESIPLGAAPQAGEMPMTVSGAQAIPLRRPPMNTAGTARYAERLPGDPVETLYSSFLNETGHRIPALPSPELAGPGVVLRDAPAEAYTGMAAHGNMVNPREIAQRGLAGPRADLANRALGGDATSELDALQQRFLAQRGQPLTLQDVQRMKQAEQGLADSAYKAEAMGHPVNGVDAQFHQGIARGSREAIEQRVPSVGPLNAQTQDLIGIRNAIENANMRNVGIGVKGLIGDAMPAVISKGAILANKGVQAAPTLLRSLMTALGYQEPPQ